MTIWPFFLNYTVAMLMLSSCVITYRVHPLQSLFQTNPSLCPSFMSNILAVATNQPVGLPFYKVQEISVFTAPWFLFVFHFLLRQSAESARVFIGFGSGTVLCVLSSSRSIQHTTGFLVVNIKHVHYLQSLSEAFGADRTGRNHS